MAQNMIIKIIKIIIIVAMIIIAIANLTLITATSAGLALKPGECQQHASTD